jgi:trimethylamine--corrinoid protein Co-methyltransferase
VNFEQIAAIHEAGMRVLERTGVVFDDEDTVRFLASHRFTTDGRRVFITPDAVTKALSTTPSSFTLRAREPSHDVVIGKGDLVSTSGAGAIWVTRGTETRALTRADLRDWIRLCHLMPNVDMLGFLLASSGTWSDRFLLNSLYDSITLTDKLVEFPASEPEHLRESLNVLEILYGSGWWSLPRVLIIVNSTSPLFFTSHACVALRELARKNQPLGVTPAAMGGMTGPVTIAGMLVQQHAEVLAGLVLVQLVRPGCPFLYGGFSSSTAMATGDFEVGSSDFWAVAAATVELAHYLGIPVRAGAGVTDSHLLDVQAGIETTMGLALVIERGVDYLLHGSGTLGSLKTVSLEKLLIDDELLGMLRERPWDVDTDDLDATVSVIDRVGPGGSFLTQRHTRANYHHTQHSSLFNRRPFDAWCRAGGRSLYEAATVEVPALLEGYVAPDIDAVVDRQLRRHCLEEAPGA